MLTDAETALLEAHFLANWGRFSSFTFTDPETGTAYSDSYYTTDEMVIEYIAPNVNRVKLAIESYNQGSGVVSATLKVLTSHIQGGGYSGLAAATSGLPWGAVPGLLFTGWIVLSTSAWTLATNSQVLTGGGFKHIVASFYHSYSSPGSASPPDEFLIYDAYIDIVYSDGTTATLRPTGDQREFEPGDVVVKLF